MILILTDELDQSTNEVIDWLISFRKPFVRINQEDVVTVISMTSEPHPDVQFSARGMSFKLSEIDSFWFRRGFFNISNFPDLSSIPEEIANKLKPQLEKEIGSLKTFVYWLLSKKKGFGNPLTDKVNKLIVCEIAKNLGLAVPETHILTSAAELKELLGSRDLVTKGIQSVSYFSYDEEYIANYTEEVLSSDITENQIFFPSLFQTKIEKVFEIRSFFLLETFYSMAIFSQRDHQTAIDFRKYNLKRPNRWIPFKIPGEIEERLRLLMQQLNLKTGSIDLIRTKDLEYVFLEVNPIGQFGMVSGPCNYFLEREVARQL